MASENAGHTSIGFQKQDLPDFDIPKDNLFVVRQTDAGSYLSGSESVLNLSNKAAVENLMSCYSSLFDENVQVDTTDLSVFVDSANENGCTVRFIEAGNDKAIVYFNKNYAEIIASDQKLFSKISSRDRHRVSNLNRGITAKNWKEFGNEKLSFSESEIASLAEEVVKQLDRNSDPELSEERLLIHEQSHLVDRNRNVRGISVVAKINSLNAELDQIKTALLDSTSDESNLNYEKQEVISRIREIMRHMMLMLSMMEAESMLHETFGRVVESPNTYFHGQMLLRIGEVLGELKSKEGQVSDFEYDIRNLFYGENDGFASSQHALGAVILILGEKVFKRDGSGEIDFESLLPEDMRAHSVMEKANYIGAVVLKKIAEITIHHDEYVNEVISSDFKSKLVEQIGLLRASTLKKIAELKHGYAEILSSQHFSKDDQLI